MGGKLFLCVVALVLFKRALAPVDLAQVFARLRDIGPVTALVLLPFPVGLLFDAGAWKLLLRRVGASVSIVRLYRVRLATEAVTLALPAGAILSEALGPLLLAPSPSVPTSFATSITKRWLIFRTHGYYVVIAATAGFGALARVSPAAPFVALGAGLALIFASFALERAAARLGIAKRAHDAVARLRASRLFGWTAAMRLERARWDDADRTFARLAKVSRKGPTALLCVHWLLESVETWSLLRVLGAPVDLPSVLSFEAALSVARSAAFFAPAGIGVQDLGYLAAFDAIGIPSAATVGPAFLLLKRAKELFWIVVGLATLALGRRKGAPAEATEDEAPAPDLRRAA
jgi:hypothetical protein